MIVLKYKSDCCGCTACKAICPASCITMQEDSEGFAYPITDESMCINCNACNRVCPVINKRHEFTPFENSDFYAAQIKDEEVLKNSSSGGMFSLIASCWLTDGGIVYGAGWDGDEIKHIKIESVEELKVLRGSKYAQSNMGDTFREIKTLLTGGEKVLFSGTPCQVDGLKRFLRKPFDTLLTIEVACHGVPSPLVLKKYLSELKSVYLTNVSLDFRDKSNGWMNYNVKALDPQGKILFCESHKDNIYMRGFLHELFSRPSCQECPSKGGTSGADLTLADFWGIDNVLPDFTSEKGVSLVLTHTHKGHIFFKSLDNLHYQNVSIEDAIRENGSLIHSELAHPERRYFFMHIENSPFTAIVQKCLHLRPITRIKIKLKAYRARLKTINEHTRIKF